MEFGDWKMIFSGAREKRALGNGKIKLHGLLYIHWSVFGRTATLLHLAFL